jgi:hypothetical protein
MAFLAGECIASALHVLGGAETLRFSRGYGCIRFSVVKGLLTAAWPMVLEESSPEDKTRNEVLEARVNLSMAAKKWDMAAGVANHLVKVQPENAGWWISLACYASVTGRMEAAKERLRHAIELDKEARKLALEDEDLKPLWDWIGGLK